VICLAETFQAIEFGKYKDADYVRWIGMRHIDRILYLITLEQAQQFTNVAVDLLFKAVMGFHQLLCGLTDEKENKEYFEVFKKFKREYKRFEDIEDIAKYNRRKWKLIADLWGEQIKVFFKVTDLLPEKDAYYDWEKGKITAPEE